ncbi:MAG: hypothetical protein ACMUIE_05335 [Thermoplasmatota archaeon]
MKRILQILMASCLLLSAISAFAPIEDGAVTRLFANTIDVVYGSNTVTIDGTNGTGEWSDAQTMTFKQSSGKVWTVRYKHDLSNLYFAFDYPDTYLAEWYFDVNNDGGSNPKTDDFKLHSSMVLYEKYGTGSDWGPQSSPPTGASGTTIIQGNFRELQVSYSKLGITSGASKSMGFAMYMLPSPAGDNLIWPSGADLNDPSTWGTISSSDLWGTGVPLNHPPVLASGMVEPDLGTTDDEFTFSIQYSDEDDDEPTVRMVYIDNVPFEMSSEDTTYADGSIFTYTGQLTSGDHVYHFLFNDGRDETRFPETGSLDGPNVILPNEPPEMIGGSIPNGTYSIPEDSGLGDDLIDLERIFSDDYDDGRLRFEVVHQESPAYLRIAVDGHYLDVIQGREDWHGTLEFKVKAIDMGLDGVVSSDDEWTESNPFTIEVTPVNDEPVITRVGPYEVTDEGKIHFTGNESAFEDTWFNISVTVDDPDLFSGWESELTFNIQEEVPIELVPKVSEDGRTTLSLLPLQEDIGTLDFFLEVEDENGGADRIGIEIDILGVNDAPVIETIDAYGLNIEPSNGTVELTEGIEAVEDEWFNISIFASDEDLLGEGIEELKFFTNCTNEGLSLDPDTGDIAFFPGQEDVGMFELHVRVSDIMGASDSVRILLWVRNENDAPDVPVIISGRGTSYYTRGEFVNLTCLGSDEDIGHDPEEELVITWSSDLDGDLGTGKVLYTDALSVGNHTITATVTDHYGLSSSSSVAISVLEIPEGLPDPLKPPSNETDDDDDEIVIKMNTAAVTAIIIIVLILLLIDIAVVGFLIIRISKKKSKQ